MKQLNLFEIAYEEYEKQTEANQNEKMQSEANQSKTEQTQAKQDLDYRLFNDCPKCKVKPVAFWSKPQATIDGWMARSRAIKCPLCGYSVATLYDPYEHWNTCNKYRVRDGKI